MLFNSFEFIIFYIILISIYFSIPCKFRWILLLFSSYFFYMNWNIEYSILLIFFTVLNYIFGIKIYNEKNKTNKKYYLIINLFSNLLLLFIFKYYNFTITSFELFFDNYGIKFDNFYLNILLPVGISFYTFQTIGYILDIYWGKIKPEKNIFIFALYVSFFPQLVAGPIERASHLLPQFREKKIFKKENFLKGIHFILWGFFLKSIIGDGVSEMVDFIYNTPKIFESGLTFLIGTYFFAFQIFGDFAGYSFIAIGTAKILGYELMENFRRPYFAKSINEFWRRWHISLSSWFKDYLYIPLGGNRVGKIRKDINVLLVFLISGIWHGANYTFILWGLLHGFYLIMEGLISKISKKMNIINNKYIKYIKIVIVFHLVMIGWILFRSNNIYDFFYIINLIFSLDTYFIEGVFFGKFLYLSILMLIWIIILEIIHFLNEKNFYFRSYLEKLNINNRIYFYIICMYIILIFGNFTKKDFIYFQF